MPAVQGILSTINQFAKRGCPSWVAGAAWGSRGGRTRYREPGSTPTRRKDAGSCGSGAGAGRDPGRSGGCADQPADQVQPPTCGACSRPRSVVPPRRPAARSVIRVRLCVLSRGLRQAPIRHAGFYVHDQLNNTLLAQDLLDPGDRLVDRLLGLSPRRRRGARRCARSVAQPNPKRRHSRPDAPPAIVVRLGQDLHRRAHPVRVARVEPERLLDPACASAAANGRARSRASGRASRPRRGSARTRLASAGFPPL